MHFSLCLCLALLFSLPSASSPNPLFEALTDASSRKVSALEIDWRNSGPCCRHKETVLQMGLAECVLRGGHGMPEAPGPEMGA